MIIPLSGDNSKVPIHLRRWAASNDQQLKGAKYFNKYSPDFTLNLLEEGFEYLCHFLYDFQEFLSFGKY